MKYLYYLAYVVMYLFMDNRGNLDRKTVLKLTKDMEKNGTTHLSFDCDGYLVEITKWGTQKNGGSWKP